MLLRLTTVTSLLAVLLLTLSGLASAAPQNSVSQPMVCQAVPVESIADKSVRLQATKAGEIGVESKSTRILSNDKAYFEGNVIIQRNGQWLSTQAATLDQQKGQIEASNGINFSDGYLNVSGESLFLDLNSNEARLTPATIDWRTSTLGDTPSCCPCHSNKCFCKTPASPPAPATRQPGN